MRPAINMLIDDRIDSYRSFFDHEWAKKLMASVEGTPLEEAVQFLHFNWKASANAQFMPWLMMESMRNLEIGYLRPKETIAEEIIKNIVDAVPAMLAEDLNKTVVKKLTKKVRRLVTERLAKSDEVVARMPMLDPQKMFHQFLHAKNTAEMQLSVYGSQRASFVLVYFEYENFIKDCTRLAIGKNKRWHDWMKLHDDIKDTTALGKALADYILKDDPVKTGRLIRNCIAHSGGKLSDKDRTDLPKGSYDEVDGFVQITPYHSRTLFDALKVRVSKMTEVTLTYLKNLPV